MEEQSIDDTWQRLKIIVKDSLIKKDRKVIKKEIGHKDWWDKECTRMKRKVHKSLKKWKKGKIGRKKYIENKKSLRELMEEKRKKKRKEEEKELRMLRNETEMWKFINKKRSKRTWVDNNIGKKDWKNYFMKLLDGIEKEDVGKPKKEESKNRRKMKKTSNEEEKRDLEEMKIINVIKKLKLKKATGIDKIPMKAWRFGGSPVINKISKVLKKVWKSGEIPKDLNVSVMVPI